MTSNLQIHEPVLGAAFAKEQRVIDELVEPKASRFVCCGCYMIPLWPVSEVWHECSICGELAKEQQTSRLTLGEPKVYMPVCPANHYGGPRACVERPEGDETQTIEEDE